MSMLPPSGPGMGGPPPMGMAPEAPQSDPQIISMLQAIIEMLVTMSGGGAAAEPAPPTLNTMAPPQPRGMHPTGGF